jgi:hypothetical protein
LSVWIARGDAFFEDLEAAHLRLDAASDMVSGPTLPERPAVVPGGSEGFVAGGGGRTVLFPGPTVLADRYDRDGLSVDDGCVSAAGVVCPIGGYGANISTFGDLIEQLRQNGAVTVATGAEFHGADIRSGLVHGQMHLAPLPPALNAMLSRLPLAIACCPRASCGRTARR